MNAGDLELIMQMRAGGKAGCANVANDLTLLYSGSITHTFGKTLHVRIQGAVALAVLDDHRVAIAALAPGKQYFAVTGAFDRRPVRGCIINPFVRSDLVQYRMLATIGKARADACKVHRRSDECFRSEEHTYELQSLLRISYAV